MISLTQNTCRREREKIEEPFPTEIRSPSERRFTVDGSEKLEAHLSDICQKFGAAVSGIIPEGKLEAIVLGGGYGRGEGGVLKSNSGDGPYNDLEFYVLVSGNRHVNRLLYQHPIEVLCHILTQQAGVELEAKISSAAEIGSTPQSMFYYDLALGHRWIRGDKAFATIFERHQAESSIPITEAARLLMNRCSGLLFAMERLLRPTFTASDADFVRRNIAKAELALGDAMLTTQGTYHWSCRERNRRLSNLERIVNAPWFTEVRARHATGVEFKLHPQRAEGSRAFLAAYHKAVTELAEKVWLWEEGYRLGRSFSTMEDYLHRAQGPAEDSLAWRNALLNARAFGRATPLHCCFSHPREAVMQFLAKILWRPMDATPNASPYLRHFEAMEKLPSFAQVIDGYKTVWSKVS